MIFPTISGEYNQATRPEAGLLPTKVPNIGYPQFWSSLAHNWMFAIRAAINMTGMFEVYIKLRGHLIPCPLILPKERGISTFIACPYTDIINTNIVDKTAAIIKPAVTGSPADRDWNKAGIAPVAIPGFAGEGKG